MYAVSTVSGQHTSSIAIVPVQSLRRSCHLIPHFGKQIDHTLSMDDSLTGVRSFMLVIFWTCAHTNFSMISLIFASLVM
jgi:hypothetical protein